MAKSRGDVLKGHKRVGKRLKSPWLTELNWSFVSYIDEILPEIVLLGLLNDAHGYARGAELTLALSRAILAANDLRTVLLSDCGAFSPPQIEQIALDLGDDLGDVQMAAAPLVCVLADHPLAALGTPSRQKADCLLLLRDCVDQLYDRDSTPACAAMANLYYAQACNGKIHKAPGLRVPNLEAIIVARGSDDARYARSEVRMLAQMLVGHRREEEEPSDWPRRFWHSCYLATDCDAEA